MINTRAAGDSRFARTGKDGAIYNADGVLRFRNTPGTIGLIYMEHRFM